MPARLSEVIKPVALNLFAGLSIARGFGAIAIERLLDAAFLAFLVLLTISTTASSYTADLKQIGVAFVTVVSLGLVICIALATRKSIISSVAARVPSRWLRRQVKLMLLGMRRSLDWRGAPRLFILSSSIWLCSYMIFFVFLRQAGYVYLSASQVLVVFVVSTLGLVISVAPGGLGTFEAAIVVALANFGYTFTDALTLAIVIRIAIALPGLVGGTWLIASGRLKIARLLAPIRQIRHKP
jgi:uncharacterized protein (TIRG00374 family)